MSVSRRALVALALVPVVARARESRQPGIPDVRRTLILPGRPESWPGQVRVAAGVATVLRFEARLDPVDGRVLPLQLVRVAPEDADTQLEVFASPFTQGALLAALEQAKADNDALQRRPDEALTSLEQYRREEGSPDALLAALLLEPRMAENFHRLRRWRFNGGRLRASADVFSINEWTAIVLRVQNLEQSEPWTLRDISFTNEESGEGRGFVFRARPSSIPPNSSGHITVVTRALPKGSDSKFRVLFSNRENSGLSVYLSGFEY